MSSWEFFNPTQPNPHWSGWVDLGKKTNFSSIIYKFFTINYYDLYNILKLYTKFPNSSKLILNIKTNKIMKKKFK